MSCSYARAAGDEDAQLARFFKNYLDDQFKLQPYTATRAGDHRFDHLLEDVSPKARALWKALDKKALESLPKEIAYEKLTRAGQIDFEILKHSLTRSLWLAENTHPFEEDPRIYNEYITGCTYELLTRSTLSQATNVKSCLARMAYIPRLVATAKESLRNPPRVFVETAIKQNRGAISYYENGIFLLAGETPQLSELKPAAKPVVEALKDYQKFLENDLLPKAKGDWRLGKEKYGQKLMLELDAGLTAEEVLREAETEFERVGRDLYVIARQMWSEAIPGEPLPPDDAEGRRETIIHVLDKIGQDHGKPEDLLRDTQDCVERIKAFIRDHGILRLPDPDNCKVIEMPEFQRGNTVAFLNPAPPLDAKAFSYYAVSPPPREWSPRQVKSFMEEYNRHMLQILSIHEAYPGHYVQLEYGNRSSSLVRKMLSTGVFEEGWAVYTEQMMLDQGYGKGDLSLRMQQLKFYLRAVANAILDYKMHCTPFSDEQAMDFLMKHVFQTEGEALGKVIRAKQSSCQLSTYFVGRTAFYRLRQQIEREQGANFNLGRYHEAVLDQGTPPVKYLPELVRAWLAKSAATPSR
ncbi:MAG: DUF885 domain-containing protein [Gemmataceae bacterium]